MPALRNGNCKVCMTAISAFFDDGVDWWPMNKTFSLKYQDQKTRGSDLLSRAVFGRGVKDTLRPIPKVHQISVCDEIWAEHLKGHWGARKTLLALWKKALVPLGRWLSRSISYVRSGPSFVIGELMHPLGSHFSHWSLVILSSGT